MAKIALLVAAPLTENIIDRVGFDPLSACHDVTIIQCVDLIFPSKDSSQLPQSLYPCLSISSIEHLISSIKRLKPVAVVDFCGQSIHTQYIQFACSRNRIPYITNDWSRTPRYAVFSKSSYAGFSLFPLLLLKALKSRLLATDKACRANTIVMVSGRFSALINKLQGYQVLITSSPYRSQHLYKPDPKQNHLSNTEQRLPSQYIVFLDDCLHASFDFLLSRANSPTTSQYYSQLALFFLQIEQYTGLSVVIAAHPNGSSISNYSSFFGDRLVFFNSTTRLVRDARLCLTHASSSLNYAVLHKKPIILLTSKEIQADSRFNSLICSYSRSLRLKTCRFDTRSLLPPIKRFLLNPTVCDEAYQRYTRNYIDSFNLRDTNCFASLTRYLS